MARLWLIRHGETLWANEGRHTSRTDVALTRAGQTQAEAVRRRLEHRTFALVLCSPSARARETCKAAGYADVAYVDPDLKEWDYGQYEGRTTPEIRQERPGWELWTDGPPGGETPEQVGERVDRVILRAASVDGDVALFGHGHSLRVLTARWLALTAAAGKLFAFGTGSICVLGYEREQRVVLAWNDALFCGES